MEIHSLYKFFLNRFRGLEQKSQSRTEKNDAAPPMASGDRRELSGLVAALRESEQLEGQGESSDPARLQELERKIDRGVYEVNPRKLAGAMLRSPENLSTPQGEDRS
jgi:anti-sigma28 factor (negative regulator of flagellin synthesis)